MDDQNKENQKHNTQKKILLTKKKKNKKKKKKKKKKKMYWTRCEGSTALNIVYSHVYRHCWRKISLKVAF